MKRRDILLGGAALGAAGQCAAVSPVLRRILLRRRSSAAPFVPFGSYPLGSGYGPARYFPVGSGLVLTGVTLNAEGAQFTVGATTGTLTMSGNSTMPVVVGETIAIWFQSVTGTPTTASIRFITAAGANIGGANTNLTVSGGYYRLEVEVPATAAYINFFVTNTTGEAIVISRPAIAVQGSFTYSTGTEGDLWLTTTAGKASGSGTAATLDTTTREVTMPSGAVQYARDDLNVGAGQNIVVAIKLSSNLVKSVLFRLQSSGQISQLECWGGGWWGRRITATGTDTSVYGQFEVDNNTSTCYTAATVTALEAYAYEGTLYPGAAPAGEVAGNAYDRSEIVVQQGPGQINIFLPGSNLNTAKYTRWQLKEYSGAGGGGFGWDIERIHEVARTADDAFRVGDNLTEVGSHRLAVMEAGAVDFVGGSTHGDEFGVSAALTIDGVSQAIDGATSYRCTTAVFQTTSQLRRVSDGTPLFDVLTVITAHATNRFRMRIQLTPLLDGLDIVRAYTHMLALSRRKNVATSGTELFTAYSNNLAESGSGAAGADVPATHDSEAISWTLTGAQGITATFEITSAWPGAGITWLQRASAGNKFYASPTGYFADAGPGATVNMVDVIDITAKYDVISAN
jgi:hypothetical protein